MLIRMKTVLLMLALAVLLALIAATAFVAIGVYNIAATVQHTRPVYWLLDVAMRRSVKLRSAAIETPALDDDTRIRNGFAHYRNHCLQCHGAPGIAPEPFALGLTPAPAALVATAREWPAKDIFWVVKYGIKMSGMPAWEYRMTDQEIWDVVAFVEHMPALSPADYQRWDRGMPARPAGTVPAVAAPSAPAAPGDVQAGRLAIDQYLCATCHQIPGIVGANRHVGPPLNGIGTRKYIAGVLPNTRENMVRWLRHPTAVDPLSAMPDLGVTEKDARDIAAYLYTLKDVE
ncbi:c-type cytochrome [Noviherbaspirillum sp.]|uniref:c-type cytochrome n=1 Tax=Noviherbaspirillum sp. TaxID=1926288 RepID=UPI002FE42BF1